MTVDRWSDDAAYDRYIGRWSLVTAAAFVDWLDIAAGSSWVDVGCGTGSLIGIILERASPASVVGVDPSAAFVAAAADRYGGSLARFGVGSADAIPLDDDDGGARVVVSGLVLTFVPDVPAALAEARRVAGPGGTVAAYVWDYAGRMDLIRRFWDAAIALDPAAAELDEGRRFPLAHPDRLADAWRTAGLADVEVRPIDIPTRFIDLDDYWLPFTTDIGPAPGYASRLPDDRRALLREQLGATLPANADGSIDLIARAWAVRGTN